MALPSVSALWDHLVVPWVSFESHHPDALKRSAFGAVATRLLPALSG